MFLVDFPCVDLNFFSLQAVGNMCIRHYDFMLGDELKRVYQNLLTSSAEIKLKTQALYNIQLYLTEEELRMIKQDQEWQKNKKLEDIKEMGDVTSGMASTIVQIYLKQILEAFLHRDLSVRLAAVRVIQLVLQQGLVHPIQV
jgi:cohesin loading factor subunit SCC2